MFFKQHFSFYSSTCVHVCHICVGVPMEARRGYQIPWNWSYRKCELPDMGSGNGTQVHWRWASAFNHWAISAVTLLLLLFCSTHYTNVHMLVCNCVLMESENSFQKFFFFFLLLFGFWGENPGQQAWQEMPLLMSQTFILKQDTKNTETGASKMAQWLRYLPTSLITWIWSRRPMW